MVGLKISYRDVLRGDVGYIVYFQDPLYNCWPSRDLSHLAIALRRSILIAGIPGVRFADKIGSRVLN